MSSVTDSEYERGYEVGRIESNENFDPTWKSKGGWSSFERGYNAAYKEHFDILARVEKQKRDHEYQWWVIEDTAWASSSGSVNIDGYVMATFTTFVDALAYADGKGWPHETILCIERDTETGEIVQGDKHCER